MSSRKSINKTPSKTDVKLKQAETLLSVSKRVSAMETVDEILESLVDIATYEMQAERGSLFINDPVTNCKLIKANVKKVELYI